MKIILLGKRKYNKIKKIQEKYPELTFQNKGYTYPNQSKWSEISKAKHLEVQEILKSHIIGFISFNHFLLSSEGAVRLRFQYDWAADEKNNPNYVGQESFIGVGYLYLDELLLGFSGLKK